MPGSPSLPRPSPPWHYCEEEKPQPRSVQSFLEPAPPISPFFLSLPLMRDSPACHRLKGKSPLQLSLASQPLSSFVPSHSTSLIIRWAMYNFLLLPSELAPPPHSNLNLLQRLYYLLSLCCRCALYTCIRFCVFFTFCNNLPMDPGPVSSLQGMIMSAFLCLPETLVAPKANSVLHTCGARLHS